MNTIKILLSCVVFMIAALLIWGIPVVAPLGRLLIAGAACLIIVLFH